jgi:hypothetical protein
LIERVDASGEWPAPAGLDHIRDRRLAALENGFHAAVAAIAHPTFHAPFDRLVFGEGAEADALHASSHDDVANNHANSPARAT